MNAQLSVNTSETSIPERAQVASLPTYSESPDTAFSLVDAPVPAPARNELLVRVRASSVNPIDLHIRRGYLRVAVGLPAHRVLGMDVAGEVVAVGDEVTAFSVGDSVFASPSHKRMGGYAQFAAVRADEAAHMPANISFEEAGGLPLAGLTAWDALVRVGQLKAGETVLIQAGAGGVGTLSIQLARHLGAHVVTTCSARNTDFVRSLGAHDVIDYRNQDYSDALKDCDLIVDCLGVADIKKTMRGARRGARIVSLTSGIAPIAARWGAYPAFAATVARFIGLVTWSKLRYGVSLRPMARKPNGANLAEVGKLVTDGVIKPVVDQVFPLADIGAAHAYLQQGHARGKVIIAP